jgi:hypothetical protein
MHHATHCLNCAGHLNISDNFCCICGQTTHAESRITMHHITHEVTHALTHADKGFFYLIKSLATQPGQTVKEYLSGKHKKYYSPFSFFFIVLGLYVLSNSFFKPFSSHVANTAKTIQTTKYPSGMTTEKQRAKYDKVQARVNTAMNFMNTRTNIVLCISTPFIAFVMFLIYRKRMYYAEHLVVMTFVNSFLNLLSIFIFTPLLYLANGKSIYFAVLIGMLLSHLVYMSIMYYRVLNFQPNYKSYLKCIGSVAVGIISWAIFSYIFIGGYIMYGML